MEYQFPKLKTYTRMSRGQLGQAYANLEQHFGMREHLPAPFDNQPYLNNDHQHAAMHMDMLQHQMANYAELRADQLAREEAARGGYRL